MDLVIKNGTVVTTSEMFSADVGVQNGKIAAIGQNLSGSEVVDARGLLVLPGGIDVHTHLQMDVGKFSTADSYFAGTRAAACGGVTTVFDFALQDYGENMVDTIKRREALCAPQAAVDYAFHVAIKDISGNLLDSMKQAVEYGVPTFKIYMVYDIGVSDGDFYRTLEESAKIGARISVHAENREIIDLLTKRFVSEGKTDPWHHYLSRAEFTEGEAVSRAITWAVSAGAPLYIVHLACKEGVEALIKARKAGHKIYAETCPQYLNFTSDVYKREDGHLFICSPPVKGKESNESLWQAIKDGYIDTVATDHCPFQKSDKDKGRTDFTKSPNGCAGVETMFPYILSEANRGRISFSRAVELCCTSPAALFGCADKGSLTPGKDADIVLYDQSLDVTISSKNMHSDVDHTIWEDVSLRGYPVQTFSRGKLVYKNGEFFGTPGRGKFIQRKLDN
jgi:dihydropyrimidinase